MLIWMRVLMVLWLIPFWSVYYYVTLSSSEIIILYIPWYVTVYCTVLVWITRTSSIPIIFRAAQIPFTAGRFAAHTHLAEMPVKVHVEYWWVGLGGGLAHHDDVIKWKHFPRYWPFVRGIHRSPVNSPHKGQWCGALMFSLICVWINGWLNNREAGDLRRYRAHYDVTVM